MISVFINGEEQKMSDSSSTGTLVTELGLKPGHFAIEINGEIIPKSMYEETNLKDGDQIEIIQAIGGG